MAHVPNGTPHPEGGGSVHLPVVRGSTESAVESPRIGGRPPLFATDLVRTLDVARDVVSELGDEETSDVSVSALTALVCTGATPADALQAAADAARRAPTLEPHGLSLARTPGPVEGMWEYTLTMTVSTRDPLTGEYGGHTHHGDPPRSKP
ncbi:hypothetical protein [Streptomyces sp. MBT53]|uniref:hypothetical protein n=1 Tax=Streptomyces sp. MBT53 TaxID=1488384 RepID=UPI00191411B5|nr:hypothetical protein [Streptomyces sp. MBT53]MBK6015815.1 hypothetical protein [Streptomyces sp. MBT53]